MKLKEYGLTAGDIQQLVNTYMIDTYERFPFVCERAKGMYLYDEHDNAYLDFYGGIAVNSVGSCADSVVAAICDQAGDVIHTFNYPYTIPQALLAEKICKATGMDKIFYQSTGTEANEAMIKLARKYGIDTYGPEKYHIVTAKNSFHGRTYGAMTATGQPDNACQIGYKPMLPGFSYATFNDLDSFRAAVTDQTIAILVEPIQGEGGVVPATMEFMQGLRALCDEKGLLLLIDEIQTGWCRTGKVMAFMHYGIKPDILSMAKAMGGGMPISAICATTEVARAFTPGSHGTTFGGNPVCCAASLAAVTEMLDNSYAPKAAETGAYLMEQLRTLPHVLDVRGKGLMIGIEFDAPVGKAIKHGCTDRRLLVTLIGGSVIRLLPPLIATKKHCDDAVSILREAVCEAYGE